MTGLGVATKTNEKQIINNNLLTKNKKHMKKILLFASALAGLFLAGCQRENLEPEQAGQQVTFTIEAPAAMQTKAIADGLNVDELIYEVWITDTGNQENLTSGATRLYQATTDMVQDGGRMKANITLDLVNDQNFTVLFWAQKKGINVYNTANLTGVTYTNTAAEAYSANDNRLDAFYAKAYVVDCQTATPTVVLRRPFAQVNLCTLNNKDAAQVNGNYNISLVSSKMRLDAVPTVFNVATSEATNYVAMEFAANTVPSGEDKMITVNGKEYFYAGMNYVFAGANILLTYDIQTKLNGTVDANVNNTIQNVPLKENHRTNIVGNLLTSKTDFEIIVDADFNIPDELVGEGTVLAKTSDDLVKALKRNEEHLVIDLVGTQTKAMTPVEFVVPITAWKTLAFGGDKTKTITINANGNKIIFDQKSNDWNHVSLNNDAAVLTINDADLATSGYNTGHWKRNILHFASDVVLNNVTAANGLGFEKDAVLNDVEVSQVGDNYAVWVWAQGQTITFDGVSVDSEGRAIKVGDEDVDGPAKVTINVANSTFKSVKKAAILVTSTAGAVINWGAGNDIKGVAADPINAVWVDEEYAQYDSEVKVEGASKVVEGAVDNVAVSTQETLTEALAAANEAETTVVVNLAEGTYTFPGSALSANVVLNCAEGTVFQGNSKANIKGATVIGATFSNPTGTAVDQTINGTFKDCVFEGSNALRWCYAGETAVFENCVFSGSLYGVHFDGGANDVLFKNCTFSGFNTFGGAITRLTFDGCKFVANGKSGYNGANLRGNTEMINTEFTFDGTASTEWVDICGASTKSYSFNGCTVCGEPMSIETIGVYTSDEKNDEVDITFNGVKYENYKTSTFISTAEELFAFANEVNVNNNTFNGKTVYLMADIDLANVAWTPVGQTGATQFKGTFNGQGNTISNLNIDATAQTGKHYSSGLFGWLNAATVKNVNIAGATVKGNHNVGVIAGYLETAGCTIEACQVTGAAVECHVANSDANGDKCGVIVGHAGNAGVVVKDCTAANSTVSAGRDAGQIAGAAKEANVTGCSATNVTVTANGEGTGANIRNEVIGRLL